MWKNFCALLKKDFRMLVSGKFFLTAIGFLILYTAYVNWGYIRFMKTPVYNVYLYDPAATQKNIAPSVQINEVIKLETMIPKAAALLPPGGRFEVPIGNADFIGFIDYLAPLNEYGERILTFEQATQFDLYDFKYSNNSKSYMENGQLHEYKYWFELTHPGCRIRNLYFLFVPKVKIRQKNTESLAQFRDRLQEALADATPWVERVEYNPLKVVDFLTDAKHLLEAACYPKKPNHFCGWCEYEEFCMKGWDYMLLPENKRTPNTLTKKVVWVYGAPFSGKTYFANAFPDPLMLNTDGNIRQLPGGVPPHVFIRDTVTVEGRLTKRKLAYEIFTETVDELEKKQNTFKTIVVDLLEDVYEACRVFICERQGWKHESDDSFRAWDMVRSEFLNTLKRLMALDYENIVLISHEDRTRDLTRKGGDKISSIKPNLQDKVANKVAGMVDLVARIVADDNERVLSFKASEVIFGGGRLNVRSKEIPLNYTAFCEVYEEANQRATQRPADGPQTGGKVDVPPTPETPENAPQTGRRRGRKPKEENPPAEQGEDCPSDTFPPVPENVPDASHSDPAQLPTCPDAERIFKQHEENPEIPLCPSIDSAGLCHKDGGPEKCPLWDRPKPEEEAPPMMDVNTTKPKTEPEPEPEPASATPPRRTRKKRGES